MTSGGAEDSSVARYATGTLVRWRHGPPGIDIMLAYGDYDAVLISYDGDYARVELRAPLLTRDRSIFLARPQDLNLRQET